MFRDRKRQHPLPHRHFGDDAIDQPSSGFRHPPRPARGANAAPFAGEGHQLLVPARGTAHPQETMRKNPAFEKRIKFVFDKLRQARRTPGFDFGEERFEILLHHAIQGCFLRPPPPVADRVCRRGAQRSFALQSHPGGNARTTVPRHRDPAGEAKGESKSTAGTARTLKNRCVAAASREAESFSGPNRLEWSMERSCS